MSRALIILNSTQDRLRAVSWVQKAPAGTRLEFKASKRSLSQNDKLWACLSDIATQVEWYGQKLTATDWKDVFTAALRNMRVVPGIDPGTYVSLGLHTSDLSKSEFSDLLELIHAFAAERGVKFHDPSQAAA